MKKLFLETRGNGYNFLQFRAALTYPLSFSQLSGFSPLNKVDLWKHRTARGDSLQTTFLAV